MGKRVNDNELFPGVIVVAKPTPVVKSGGRQRRCLVRRVKKNGEEEN